jgi:hypothetical protein
VAQGGLPCWGCEGLKQEKEVVTFKKNA